MDIITATTTVSYTHLDVYKRQPLSCATAVKQKKNTISRGAGPSVPATTGLTDISAQTQVFRFRKFPETENLLSLICCGAWLFFRFRKKVGGFSRRANVAVRLVCTLGLQRIGQKIKRLTNSFNISTLRP